MTVYIDWNQDRIFDPVTELVASYFTVDLVDGQRDTVSTAFVVPSTAALGPTVMRILQALEDSPVSPCSTDLNGDFEDYSILVTAVAPTE